MRIEVRAWRWFIGVWVLLTLVKLAWPRSLPLFVDEAFYWQEGQHLAWAYSDLPGLTAWLTRLGVARRRQQPAGVACAVPADRRLPAVAGGAHHRARIRRRRKAG